MAKRYVVRDREAGNEIEKFKTAEDARKALNEYEESDKAEGIYEEGFYEVYDSKKEEIL